MTFLKNIKKQFPSFAPYLDTLDYYDCTIPDVYNIISDANTKLAQSLRTAFNDFIDNIKSGNTIYLDLNEDFYFGQLCVFCEDFNEVKRFVDFHQPYAGMINSVSYVMKDSYITGLSQSLLTNPKINKQSCFLRGTLSYPLSDNSNSKVPLYRVSYTDIDNINTLIIPMKQVIFT